MARTLDFTVDPHSALRAASRVWGSGAHHGPFHKSFRAAHQPVLLPSSYSELREVRIL